MHRHEQHDGDEAQSLNRIAASATTHCLTGCAIGEVLGFVIGTWRGWGDVATMALAIVLAYAFGYVHAGTVTAGRSGRRHGPGPGVRG